MRAIASISMFNRNHATTIALIAAMLTLCCLPPAYIALSGQSSPGQSSPGQTSRSQRSLTHINNKAVPSIEAIAKPHLAAADRKIELLCRRDYAAISEVFNRARGNADDFASLCLGWSSKWRLAADAVPFTQGDRHTTYIREQFERQMFSESQMERAIEQTVASFLADIRSVESQMLVDLRADVADFPECYNMANWSPELIQSRFDEAIQVAIARTGSDLQANIGTQVISIIAGEVLTQVAVRLGVSAGILGTGAASGWATLGIGVVVGLVIDQIVAWIWDSWADPHGELTQNLIHKLDVLQSLICFGDQQVDGLEQRFKRITEQRSITRRDAILSLLKNDDAMSANMKSAKRPIEITVPGTRP